MTYFELPEDIDSRQYAEKLNSLMDNWENETVEFKEAKSSYDTDKIGRYFSALSNEANLKQLQCGWLVFGVSEDNEKHLVGTHYKEGDRTLLEKFKGEISKGVTGNASFDDIIELSLVAEGKTFRVLMFRIPAAATGIPTEWKGRAYGRSGDTTVPLPQDKIDRIRTQERDDWSRQVISDSDVSCLDQDAINIAREKYKKKLREEVSGNEVDQLSDEELLSKMALIKNGKLTNAALLLLGKPECTNLFAASPKIMWRLYDSRNDVKDYAIFDIPFINVIDKVLGKVRILNYQYMPNMKTLFPETVPQYDSWLLRELLNNCIAHSNYRLGGRIYLNEFEDKITITNPGSFIPKSIDAVLEPGFSPPFYRNQLLADAMVKFDMIDTASMGISRVFRIQRDRYFPLPDYNLKTNQVDVAIYGKILNETYMHILFNRPDLEFRAVFLMDQLQKGNKLPKEAIDYLRKNKLIEGKGKNLFFASGVARDMEKEAQYIKNKGFNDKYYKDFIIKYLKEFGKAQKRDLRNLLWDKLPDILSDSQKEMKIQTLLRSLKNEGIIRRDSENRQSANWVLS